MQPFQPPRGTVPRPTPGQIPGAGPIPGARIPGPQPGGPRPGVPKPGMPGPMGIKPQIPPNIPATQPPTINAPKEELQQPADIPTQEPVKNEVPETKPEPLKTEPPIKGPPQLEQKPPGQPKPMGVPKPQTHPAPGFRPGAPPGVGVSTGIPGSGGPVGPSGPSSSGGPGGPPSAGVSAGPGGLIPSSGPTSQGGPIGNKPPGPGPTGLGGPMGNRPPGPGPVGMPGQVRPPGPSGPGAPGMPKATAGPSDEPKPIVKKPGFVQNPAPQFPGVGKQAESRENKEEPGSDHLVRLSESLQAMKNLRSNFQGFNNEDENDQEEEEESPGIYEGGEDDDYVRVEGEDDGREYNDEDQQYDQEEEDDQGQENQDQYDQYEDEQEEEEQNYEEEEEQEMPPQVNQQRLPPIVEERAPPTQAFQPKPRLPPQNIVEERKEPPQDRKPSFKAEMGPPQAGLQPTSAAKIQRVVGETRREEPIHQPVRHVKESPERTTRSEREETIGGRSSEYDRIVRSEPEVRVDPNLVIKVEKLELELEKERKKNAILESEQERLINENNTLKHRNTELATRMEVINRREGAEKTPSQADVETLKYELNRSLEECRQFSGDANRVIHETSQYRQEAESLINSLEEDKNRLHHQVLELRRQIDEEYVSQVESFRQRTELLEMNIRDYESNFQIVQGQLKEKTETLQRVTSLNSEIQATLSSLPKALNQVGGTAHPPVRTAPAFTPQQSKPMQVNKPADNKSAQKQANIPPAHTETPPVVHQQEQDQPPSRKASQQQTSAPPGPLADKGQGEVNTEANFNFKPNVPHQTGSQIEAYGLAKPAAQDFAAPPNYRIPGKKVEPPKKQPVGFRPMTEQVQTNQAEENKRVSPQKEVGINEGVIEEQKTASASKPITAHSIQPKAKPPQTNKNPFDEVENAENFFDNLGSAQKSSQIENQQQESHYQEQQQPEVTYGGYEETQHPSNERLNPFQDHSYPGIERPPSNVSSNKQSKSNLRYSQSKLAVEKEQNPTSAEAAENFFDQLGTTQEQNYPQPTNEAAEDFFDQLGSQNQPPSQPQPETTAEDFFDQLGSGPTPTKHQSQPQPQRQYYQQPSTQAPPQPKAQIQSATPSVAKKGKNPFASEDEDIMQTSGQFQSSNLESSFNRPQENRPPQMRTAPGPQVNQTPVQRGRNPFASEDIREDVSQSSDFLQSSQDSFVNRPEAQRFNQIKSNVGPVQTAPVKRVEPAKGSALKKTRGAIPASMFD